MKNKLFLLFVCCLIAIPATAQKVKIKKGEIQIDGTPVAKMEKVKGSGSEYIFSDLNGTALFNANLVTQTPEGNPLPESILVLKAPNGNVKEFDKSKIKISFSLSMEKLMCDLVMNCGANLITTQGVDLQKVNEYFQTSDRSITAAFDNRVNGSVQETKEEDAQAAKDGLKIDSNGDVWKGANKIGKVTMKKDDKESTYKYVIIDKDLNPIGGVYIPYSGGAYSLQKPVEKDYTAFTFDGQKLPMQATFNPISSSVVDDVANRLLKKLYYSGYKFDELSINDMKNIAIEKAKANSKNIYDVQGYIIDKDGNKNEGLITIEFQSLDDLIGKSGGKVVDLTNYGGSATLKSADGKSKTYNAKDRITVFAGDRKFVGLPGASMLDGAKLYEVIFEKEGNMVLYSVNYDEYLLKTENQDKAKQFSSQGIDEIESVSDSTKILFREYVKHITSSAFDSTMIKKNVPDSSRVKFNPLLDKVLESPEIEKSIDKLYDDLFKQKSNKKSKKTNK